MSHSTVELAEEVCVVVELTTAHAILADLPGRSAGPVRPRSKRGVDFAHPGAPEKGGGGDSRDSVTYAYFCGPGPWGARGGHEKWVTSARPGVLFLALPGDGFAQRGRRNGRQWAGPRRCLPPSSPGGVATVATDASLSRLSLPCRYWRYSGRCRHPVAAVATVATLSLLSLLSLLRSLSPPCRCCGYRRYVGYRRYCRCR